MVSTCYATATTALCAEFDRFLHPPPLPHLSQDYRPNRHVAAHIPSPAPIAAHAMRPRLSPQRFKIARPSPRSTPCTQSPLLLLAATRSQLHTARPRPRPGGTQRQPVCGVFFWGVIRHVVPTQLRLMSASLDARSAVICLFGFSSLKFRPASAADAVVQTTIELNQSPCRDRRLSTPLHLRTISLKFRATPAASIVVRTATEPPTIFIAAFPYTPQAPAPNTSEPTA